MAWYDDDAEVAPAALNAHLPLLRQLEGSGDGATSPAGAQGRYQIMPDTARRYGFDPAKIASDQAYAARAASAIMDDNLKRGGGRLDDALVLYNASPKVYRKWVQAGRDPNALPDETRKYLARAEKITGGPLAAPEWAVGDAAAEPVAAAPAWAANDPALKPGAPKDRSALEQFVDFGHNLFAHAAESTAGLARGIVGQAEAEANTAAKGGAIPTFLPGGADAAPLSEETRQQATREIATSPHPTQQQVAEAVSPLQEWGKAHEVEDPGVGGKVGGFVGGMLPMLATGVAGPAGAVIGFQGSGYDTEEQDALQHHATPAEAEAAGIYGAGIGGVTGAVPVGEVAGAAIEKTVLKGLPAWLAERGVSSGLMGSMMGGQTAATNLVAQQTYDPDRPWNQQVAESVIGGALGDFGFGAAHAVGHVAVGASARATGKALGSGWDWAAGALRPAEKPPGAPPVDPETMPSADAIQRYAGIEPKPPEMPTPDGGAPQEHAPEAAQQTTLQEGDAVLVHTPDGLIKADVKAVNHAEEAPPTVTISTPAGETVVPATDAVALPKGFEVAREAYGAPLEQMPQAIADTAAWKASPKAYNLFQAIKDLGGIRTKDVDGNPNDAAEILKGAKGLMPGVINNQKSGLDPDTIRALLQQRGWFGDFDQSQLGARDDSGAAKPGDDIDHLWEKLRDQAQGRKVFHPETQTAEALAHREELDNQMIAAGVGAGDSPQDAAAKLAGWRAAQVRDATPEAELLKARAEELGLAVRDGASYEEILGDVLEREAIMAEQHGELPAEGYEDLVENAIDRATTPEQRLELAVLTDDEHEWLAHPDRGGRGVEGEAFGADDPVAEAQPGGAGTGAVAPSGAGAAGRGEDQGSPGEGRSLEPPTGFEPAPPLNTPEHHAWQWARSARRAERKAERLEVEANAATNARDKKRLEKEAADARQDAKTYRKHAAKEAPKPHYAVLPTEGREHATAHDAIAAQHLHGGELHDGHMIAKADLLPDEGGPPDTFSDEHLHDLFDRWQAKYEESKPIGDAMLNKEPGAQGRYMKVAGAAQQLERQLDALRKARKAAGLEPYPERSGEGEPPTVPTSTSETQKLGSGESVQQNLLAGTERSAKQAAAAREGALKPKAPQRDDLGGLFDTEARRERSLFDEIPSNKNSTETPREIPTSEAAREAQVKAEQPKPGEGYGDKNKLVSRDQYEEAKRKLRDKLRNQLNAGLDPEALFLGTQMAAFHLEAGARKLGDFVRAMVDDLGEGAVPYLKMWYEGARHYPGNDYAREMSPTELVTPETIERIASDVLRSSPDLESDRAGAAAGDGDGAQPVPAVGGQADRGAGGAGAGAAAAGDRAAGGDGLQRGGAAAVGEQGGAGLQPGSPGAGSRAAGRGEPVGGGAPRDEGIQPDRTPAADLDAVAAEAAHLEPVSQNAQPDSLAPDAPPVSHDLEAALPALYPAQRGDVAFAEQRFDKVDAGKAEPGVLFTNGTGTGKTFTGLGVVKRFIDRGKREILVVAPSQGILNQWVRDGEKVGVHVNILEDTSSAGRGVTATTYANFGQNRSLADRKWDLVVADEAHKLTENAAGDETLALAALRAITNHPKRRFKKAEMLLRADVDKVEALAPAKNQRPTTAYLEARARLDEKLKAKVEELKDEPRSKAVFLSATPFPYDKSVDWGSGYLFDYGPDSDRSYGYNQPNAQQAFFMQHFGYRMKYNKLTRPESAVDSEIMERQFHEHLRSTGALSGRQLDIPFDYDRRFVLVDSAVGHKIDQALSFLMEADQGKFRNLAEVVRKRFDYLARERLLEAIKAKEAIPILKKHLALGRKAVIFHQFNDGGGFSPFAWAPEFAKAAEDPATARALHAEFLARNPYVGEIDADLSGLASPIEQLTKAFPEAMVYNGRVRPKGRREAIKAAFNTDDNGKNLIIVQSDAGEAGISLHDTTGRHQRVLMNLGLPKKPSTAIQQEGRIYRDGNQSDALFRYMNTGTSWERSAFASKMAERSGTAENLAMGERARAMREAYINAYLDSAAYPPSKGEGKGGKASDRSLQKGTTQWERAKSFYFAEAKKTGRRDQREGLDYFPTPEPVGLKMAQWADIRPGNKVLEPSAGHGAIARWFPETSDRTLIEPSRDLSTRAGLTSPGAHVITDRFENLHAVNKYDAIVMNPPFGSGGATAVDHLAKAIIHLKDGGRVVALIPRGPAADARFEKMYDSELAKGVYMVADIHLPQATFERAGTKVSARIVVLEKQSNPLLADKIQQRNMDFSGEDSTKALFDRLEHASLPERSGPADVESAIPPVPAFVQPILDDAKLMRQLAIDRDPESLREAIVDARKRQRSEALAKYGETLLTHLGEDVPASAADRLQAEILAKPTHGGFAVDQTVHSKTGEDLYVATAKERVSSDEYKALNTLAKKHGGWYSSFRGKGAIPGFQFKSEAAREAFLQEAAPVTEPSFARVWHGSPHEFEQFDIGQLGSGEGAQAYGHGLYFAGERQVAEHYRDKLTDDRLMSPEVLADYYEPGRIIRARSGEYDKVLAFHAPKPDDPWRWSVDVVHTDKDGQPLPGARPRNHATQPSVAEVNKVLPGRAGKLYEVEVPEHSKFLDRDRKVGDQSNTVRKQLDPLLDRLAAARSMGYPTLEALHMTDERVDQLRQMNPGEFYRAREYFDGWTGGHLYDTLSEEFGAAANPDWTGIMQKPEAASDLLRGFGIPGLAYKDGLSRSVKEGGTHNYVVFHHDDTAVAAKFARGGGRRNNLIPAASTPPERLKEIAERAANGESYRTIMREMGVSSSTINRALQEHNVPRRPAVGQDGYTHPATIEQAKREEAIRLYRDEMSADQIARRLGISQPVVSRIVKAEGLTRSPSDRMALRSRGQTRAERGISMPWQSAKDGSWHYAHSTYEAARMHQLDADPGVASYTKRTDRIPMPDGTTYLPDLEVHYSDGRTVVEEIKPEWMLADPGVQRKAAVAREHFKGLGKDYELVSEYDIGRKAFEDLKAEPHGNLPPEQRARVQKALGATIQRMAKEEEPRFRRDPLERSPELDLPASDQLPDIRIPKGLLFFRALDPDSKGQALIDAVDKALQKLAPFAEAHAADMIRETDGHHTVEGVAYRDGLRHIVLWSLEAADGLGVARHEAVHVLRKAGLFRPEEWDALAQAAQGGDWIGKHQIAERYPDLSPELQLEEAIAEQFRFWRTNDKRGLQGFAKEALNRLGGFLDHVRDFVRQALNKAPDAKDVISRLERGAIGQRLGREVHAGAEGDPAFARRARSTETPEPEERRPGGLINQLLGERAQNAGRKLKAAAERWTPDPVADGIDDLKLNVSPMGMGSVRAQAEAKDFANAIRASVFEHGKIDDWLAKRFRPEEQKLMWEAADEHGVLLRRGVEPGPGQGKNRLTPEQRRVVDQLQEAADRAFEAAQELGMVNGDGLESYVPRMVAQMTAFGPRTLSKANPRQAKRGANLSTTTGQLRQRKYETVEETEAAAQEHFGDRAMVIRNIRTLNLATQRLEQAIAGRVLVDKIKDAAKQTGSDPVVEGGANPDPGAYFTMEHPALSKWALRGFVTDPETGKTRPQLDEKGDPIFDRQPIWIPKEYEGPLNAVLSSKTGELVRGLLELKAKMIGVIMYNPMIHNAVIWGKAIPADPKGVLSFQAYRDGYAAKSDPATMREALAAGLDPIGHRFFNQDLASLATEPGIVPGRSWTAQLLGKVGDIFGRDSGDAVRRTVDQLGDVWHNTFLWDRIADLQMGLYVKIRDQLLRQSNQTGMSAKDAQRVAAHFANRYAGALPMESMSKMARNMANLVLFSRSFTLGNLAAYKDVLAGMPSDVRAQIERDRGPLALNTVQGVARRKAIGMLALDIGLSSVGLALASLMTAWLTQQKWQLPWDNEPERKNRFLIGYQKDGTAIYGRLPTGKVGEELYDWATNPHDILMRKLSPYGRFAYLLATNDKGFGQHLNDPTEHIPVAGPVKHVLRAAWQSFGPSALLPESQMQGLGELASGKSPDPGAAALRAFLPLAGITVSKGAPGGPAIGDLYAARERHDYAVQQALPDIRQQIKEGDIVGARKKMTELGIAPGLQGYYIRVARNPNLRLSPRQLRDFAGYATPQEKAEMAKHRAEGMARRQALSEEQ